VCWEGGGEPFRRVSFIDDQTVVVRNAGGKLDAREGREDCIVGRNVLRQCSGL